MNSKVQLLRLLNALNLSIETAISSADRANQSRTTFSDQLDYGFGKLSRDEMITKGRKRQSFLDNLSFETGSIEGLLDQMYDALEEKGIHREEVRSSIARGIERVNEDEGTTREKTIRKLGYIQSYLTGLVQKLPDY